MRTANVSYMLPCFFSCFGDSHNQKACRIWQLSEPRPLQIQPFMRWPSCQVNPLSLRPPVMAAFQNMTDPSVREGGFRHPRFTLRDQITRRSKTAPWNRWAKPHVRPRAGPSHGPLVHSSERTPSLDETSESASDSRYPCRNATAHRTSLWVGAPSHHLIGAWLWPYHCIPSCLFYACSVKCENFWP